MSRARRGGATKAATRTVTTVVLEHEPRREKKEKRERKEDALDRVFEKVAPVVVPPVAAPQATTSTLPRALPRVSTAPPMLRTARVVSMAPGKIEIAYRGSLHPTVALLGDGVDRALVAQAMRNRDVVLVEWVADGEAAIVGIVQTRIPSDVVLKGQKITIEADQELTLRSGTAAVRLREDGDVEVVGSRIAIASRGLFRLVGRMLRLN